MTQLPMSSISSLSQSPPNSPGAHGLQNRCITVASDPEAFRLEMLTQFSLLNNKLDDMARRMPSSPVRHHHLGSPLAAAARRVSRKHSAPPFSPAPPSAPKCIPRMREEEAVVLPMALHEVRELRLRSASEVSPREAHAAPPCVVSGWFHHDHDKEKEREKEKEQRRQQDSSNSGSKGTLGKPDDDDNHSIDAIPTNAGENMSSAGSGKDPEAGIPVPGTVVTHEKKTSLPPLQRRKARSPSWFEGIYGEEMTSRQLTWVEREDEPTWAVSVPAFKTRIVADVVSKIFELEDAKAAGDRVGWAIVHSPIVQWISSIVIILNAITFGYSAQRSLEDPEPGTFEYTTTWFFTLFFIVELSMRFLVERTLFFFGREWKWNLLDTILVMESVVSLAMDEKRWSSTMGRVLRIARFFRLARITRVVRHLGALRLVLFAILDSMSSLFWCFIVVGLVIYVFSVIFVHAGADYMNGSVETSQSHLDLLRHWYGGVVRTMISLFMAITGGADWHDVLSPMKEISPVYESIFFFFVFVMQFGVLNIVLGTFVATATEVASKDREAMIKSEMSRLRAESDRIRSFFHEADTNHSGRLSWLEFERHMRNRKVKAHFQSLDIDVSQAHIFFKLLDQHQRGAVTIDEFVDGCMRLKGEARSIDLKVLMFVVERLSDNLMQFMKSTESKLNMVKDAMGCAMSENIDTEEEEEA